ncbi:hypothetical protein, partial [Bathymodiolus thermophilus thioautotrophic gill symbiont]
ICQVLTSNTTNDNGGIGSNSKVTFTAKNGFGWFSKARRNIAKFYKKYGRQIASIDILFIPGVNIYVAGFFIKHD